MIKTLMNFKFTVILFTILLFQSCIDLEDEKTVKKKCRWYLYLKYGKEFDVLDFSQSISGVTWKYTTNLLMASKDNKDIVFDLSYNAYNGRVNSDGYKSTLWYWQFSKELEQVVSKYKWPVYINSMFGESLKTYLSCSDMENNNHYDSALKNLEQPASMTYLYLGYQKDKTDQQLEAIMDICRYIKRKPFVVNKFEIYFCTNDFFSKPKNKYNKRDSYPKEQGFKKQLFFKYTLNDSLPSKKQLEKMIVPLNTDTILVNKNEILFRTAKNETEPEKAIKLYQEISSNVSNYRFNTYDPFQSAYKVESLYELAVLKDSLNQKEEAKEYYQRILKYFEYEEKTGVLLDYYRKAKLKLEPIN